MNLKNDLKTKNLETDSKIQLCKYRKSKIQESIHKKINIFQDKYLKKKKSLKKNNLL